MRIFIEHNYRVEIRNDNCYIKYTDNGAKE